MVKARFSTFVAIDWSGAAGERHRGIAVAWCDSAGHAPRLVTREQRWSRADILAFLLNDLPDDAVVGLDLGISLPFADSGAFFPGWDQSPADARALWALVDDICAADSHLGVSSFVDHPRASCYFRRHGGREGVRFHAPDAADRRGRMRVTEARQAAAGCKPYSNFNLVGAAQVGKSSLSGMRVLHRLDRRVPVWPIDPLPARGPVIVEIYTTLAAIAAGRGAARAKMTTIGALNTALARLGCPPVTGPLARAVADTTTIDDHAADALVTAAWLRNAAHVPALWAPDALTTQIARTEGWTFGAT